MSSEAFKFSKTAKFWHHRFCELCNSIMLQLPTNHEAIQFTKSYT